MSADLVELIKKAAEGKIDFRSALRGFRASILSQKRRLTRMRPSRRFGFEQMGSHYDFTTHLLVAIDIGYSTVVQRVAAKCLTITVDNSLYRDLPVLVIPWCAGRG